MIDRLVLVGRRPLGLTMVFVFRHKTCLRRLKSGVAAFVQFGRIRGSQTQRILGHKSLYRIFV